MRLTKPLALVLLAGIPMVFASCFWLNMPLNTEGGYDAEFHQVVSLEPGATVRLDCAVGDVEIQGGDRTEVEVSARQEGGPSYTWSWFSGWSVRPAPRVSVEAADNVVTIKTVASEDPDLQPKVHFLLLVPESVKLKDIEVGRGDVVVGDLYGELKVSLREGDLTIENFSGSVEASVGEGMVEAEVLDLRAGDQVVIEVEKGDIDISLEKGFGAKLVAEAPQGAVGDDFGLKADAEGRKLSAVIGDGRAAVSLKARDGDIRIKKTD